MMKNILYIIIFLPELIFSQIDTTDLNNLNFVGQKIGVWKQIILPNKKQNISDTLIAYFTYKRDLKDGEYNVYTSKKKLLVKGNYKNGKRNGEIINYYSDGTIKNQFNEIDDIMDGSFKSYWENGNIKKKLYYDDGKIIGTIKHYYENGSLWFKIIKDNQNPKKELWVFYHKSGKMKLQGNKLNDENIGIWKEYSEDGKITSQTEYK